MKKIDNSKFSNYDESWKNRFEEEKIKLTEVFKDQFVRVEHIGSTSIPGLAAKPIIDIGVLIESIDDKEGITSALKSLGYEYKPNMSSGERLFLRKGDPVEYHLSIACPKHSFWSRNILFRDYLIKYPEFIKEYENLKLENLQVTPENDFEDLSLSEVYNQGKGEFVKKILDLADLENLQNVKYFIAIPILGELSEKIKNFRRTFLTGSLMMAEPHVTVKAHGGLSGDEKWVSKIKEAIEKTNCFELTLKGVDTFGNKVILLKAEPFEKLFQIHKMIVDEVNPGEADIKKYHELGSYAPHSTLYEATTTEDHAKFLEIFNLATNAFNEKFSFNVSTIRIYKQDIAGMPYRKLIDIELAQ